MNRFKSCLVITLVLQVCVGCAAYRPAADLKKITCVSKELAAIDIEQPGGVNGVDPGMRIVDIHAHTFNARYLPLRGIALGKRDAFPIITWTFTDKTAESIAVYLNAMALLEEPPKKDKEDKADYDSFYKARELQAIHLAAEHHGSTPRQYQSKFSIVYLRRTVCKALDIPTDHITEVQPERFRDRLKLWVYERLFKRADDPENNAKILKKLLGEMGHTGFIRQAVQPIAVLPDNFHAAFDHNVGLMVSHMMDLGPVYNQRPSANELVSFADQVPEYKSLSNDKAHKMTYFVAYNPYRDHWPREHFKETDSAGLMPIAGHQTAFDIVEDALRNKGAYGVKLYPPSGYSPIGNKIPDRPWWTITPYPKAQWHARYGGVTAKELDQRLCTLLRYCEKYNIPVFVHTSPGEFEARKGYSKKLADPKFWKQYFQKRDEVLGGAGRCKLRLCFGHAGGERYWFGAPHGEAFEYQWGETIHEMCRKYENVYMEFGALGTMVCKKCDCETPGQQGQTKGCASGTKHTSCINYKHAAALVCRMRTLLAQDENPTSPGNYKLRNKIIYGSDWFMPSASHNPKAFLRGYQTVFLHEDLSKYYESFFRDNALRYLDLPARLDNKDFPVDPVLRKHYEALFKPSAR